MKKHFLIPVMLLIIFAAPPTQAEDMFDVKIGTHFDEIKKSYPDIKLWADTFTNSSEEKRKKYPNTYSIKLNKSAFGTLTLTFDDDKLLRRFFGIYNVWIALERAKGDLARLYTKDYQTLRFCFEISWLELKLQALVNLPEPVSETYRTNYYNVPLVTTTTYLLGDAEYVIECDERNTGTFSVTAERIEKAKPIH